MSIGEGRKHGVRTLVQTKIHVGDAVFEWGISSIFLSRYVDSGLEQIINVLVRPCRRLCILDKIFVE
jgi:hypothetical protein